MIYKASSVSFNDFKNRFSKLKNKEWFLVNETTIEFIKKTQNKKDNRVKRFGIIECRS